MRGTAFVVFREIQCATAARKNLQNFVFYERPMIIDYAKTKSDAVSKLDGTYQYVLAAKQAAREKRELVKKLKAEVPKRPTTAFLFFSHDARAAVAKKLNTKDVTLVAAEIGRRWKLLTDADKQKYEKLHQEDERRFTREKAEYDKKHPAPPKRPLSAMFFYLQEVLPPLKKANPTKKQSELMKLGVAKWKTLTAKQNYEKKAVTAKADYLKAIAAFKTKHGEIPLRPQKVKRAKRGKLGEEEEK